jgi:hypothetical protein
MENPMRIILLVIASLALSGCLARTAANVVTAPVKAGGKVVDWTTTSQDEADRNRGREIRKQEARDRKECRRGGRRDC